MRPFFYYIYHWMFDYIIYTDGGYTISNNVGAGAYVILEADGKTLVQQNSFLLKKESSQRAELKAIIAAVEALPDYISALVCTDYLNASIVLRHHPRRKNKPDKDLILQYRQLIREKHLKVELKWVRSHKHSWNEFCDNLCKEAYCHNQRI